MFIEPLFCMADLKQQLLHSLKTIQMIETCARIVSAWLNRNNDRKGRFDFISEWDKLQAFLADGDIKVSLECKYMHNLNLTVRCMTAQESDLSQHLKYDAMKKKFSQFLLWFSYIQWQVI